MFDSIGAYKRTREEILAEVDTLINASEGGASIRGFEEIRLEESGVGFQHPNGPAPAAGGSAQGIDFAAETCREIRQRGLRKEG